MRSNFDNDDWLGNWDDSDKYTDSVSDGLFVERLHLILGINGNADKPIEPPTPADVQNVIDGFNKWMNN